MPLHSHSPGLLSLTHTNCGLFQGSIAEGLARPLWEANLLFADIDLAGQAGQAVAVVDSALACGDFNRFQIELDGSSVAVRTLLVVVSIPLLAQCFFFFK